MNILLRCRDPDNARRALEAARVVHRSAAGIDMFPDGPGGRFRDAVHVIFADEQLKSDNPGVVPSVQDTGDAGTPSGVVSTKSPAKIKLGANCDKDRTDLQELSGIQLIDKSSPGRSSSEPGARRRRHVTERPGG